MQKIIKILFLLAFLFLLVFLFVDSSDVLGSMKDFSFWSLLFAFFLYLVFYAVNAKVLMLFMGGVGYRLSFFNALGVNQFSSLFNYIAPFRAGQFAIKAVLLKLLSGVSVSYSVVSFFSISIFSLFSSAFLFLISAFFLDNVGINKGYITLSILFFLVAVGSVVAWWLVNKLGIFEKRLSKAKVLISGLSVRLVVSCVALLVFQIVVSSLITIVFLDGVGVSVSLVDAVFLSSVGGMVFLASITPGNLGAKELTLVGIGIGLGIPEGPMLAVLIADRLLQVFISGVFSTAFFYRHKSVVAKALNYN